MDAALPAHQDLTAHATAAGDAPEQRFSRMAGALIGSEILKIAADIRTMVAQGHKVCNLTVGDFNPQQFPIPEKLHQAVLRALEQHETNYPAANGQLELRQALQRFYERELGLRYPLDSFLVAGGARPVIYGTYRTLVDEGDTVIYPVPSWNNNHYVHMSGARGVPVVCGPESRFLPTGEALLSELPSARLVCLNSPLNPTGTAIDAEALRGICEAILAENRRREASGQRPVYLMYDHIYWMLCFGGTHHVTPPGLCPEMARYTVFVDGISKAFAATGLRVGWAVGPVDVIRQMSAVIGHVGAWAPRPEQVATVELLDDPSGDPRLPPRVPQRDRGAAGSAPPRVPGAQGRGPAGRQHPADGGDLPDRADLPVRPDDAVRAGAADQRGRPEVRAGRRGHRHRPVPGVRGARRRRLVPPQRRRGQRGRHQSRAAPAGRGDAGAAEGLRRPGLAS
jgi:aspartate aminotransferase